MDSMNEYQREAAKTAVYPSAQALPYLALGLAGEAAEVANKIKKILRGDYDDDPEAMEITLELIAYELGDVLWYVALLSRETGIDLSDVAGANINKLHSRMRRGTIHGSGDKR